MSLVCPGGNPRCDRGVYRGRHVGVRPPASVCQEGVRADEGAHQTRGCRHLHDQGQSQDAQLTSLHRGQLTAGPLAYDQLKLQRVY